MRVTEYFKHTRLRADREAILDQWIMETINRPDAKAVQTDQRIRLWKWIAAEQKWLRVVLLEDAETVHNAFFDRSFKP